MMLPYEVKETVMLQEYTYIIPGMPLNYHKFNLANQKEWGNQHEILLNHRQILLNQHNDKPLFDGPIHIETVFYFPIHNKQSHVHYLPFKFSFFNLIKYVQRISEDVILTKNAYITSFESTIRKSYDPRTVLIFRKDEYGKKQKN